MEALGPGVRAIIVDSPYGVDRCTLFDGSTVVKGDGLTVRAEPAVESYFVSFPARADGFVVPAGHRPLGWLTRVKAEVLAGRSATVSYCADDHTEPFGEETFLPRASHVDLLLDDPGHGARIVFGRGRRAGVKLKVTGFECLCLVDEESPELAEPPRAALELQTGWSRFFGRSLETIADRVRLFRYDRMTGPRAMRWLENLEVVILPREQVSRAVYLSGLYEPCTTSVLKRVLKAGGTFVDVGANIGLFSMLAAKWVGPSGSILAFEPSRREVARLTRHIERNGLGNVRIVQAALGSREGTAVLHVADDERAGLNTLESSFMYEGVAEAYEENVPVMRLDDFVTRNGIAKVDAIKIDVEGSEPEVVAGARETIARDRPILFLESAGRSAQGRRADVETLLATHGYEIVAIDGETGKLRRVADLSGAAENFLAAPPAVVSALARDLPDSGLRTSPSRVARTPGDPEPPYVSIILTGRNDDFGGDFNDRLFRALEFNHRHLSARGIPHEFVFCEWRPVAGKPWLAEVLADRYPELVPRALTSYVADLAYHEAYSLNPKLQFQEFIAKNIGIRRCRGEYILTTNTDVYLSRGVLDVLEQRALKPRVLYRVPRIDLKDAIDTEHLDWSVLEDERNEDMVNTIQPPLYTNASGDFLLLDRDSYAELRGFNEIYRVAKVHMDSNFCLKAYTSGLTLTPIEAPVYHVGRGTLNSQVRLYADRPQDAPWGDRRWKRGVLYENDADWGLAQAPTRTVRPGIHFLDFSWDAVPPTVSLKRVVLPVERLDTPSALPHLLATPVSPTEPAAAPPYPISITHRELVIDPETPTTDHVVFEDHLAVTINRARLDFLASLDLPVAGTRVLDAGCGVGHHTPFYVSQGCQVVGIDGRAENIALMAQLYPDVQGISGDLQTMDLESLGSFDIVHCFGLLYHLDSPVAALRRLAGVCREYLILETMVCDSKAPTMVLADEQLSANQALAGLACRPSPSFVAMTLDRLGFPFVYGTTAPPRHPDFEFTWQDDLAITRNGHNLRCIFVASRRPVAASHLVELLGR